MEEDEEHSFTTAELFDLAVLYVRWVAVASPRAAAARGPQGAPARGRIGMRGRIGNHAGCRHSGDALARLVVTQCGVWMIRQGRRREGAARWQESVLYR